MIKTRQVRYTECDGCGYSMNTDVYHTVLELGYDLPKGEYKGKLTFHFHASKDEHDCLRYWMTSERVMRRSLEERKLSGEIIDHILKTTAAFQKKP